MEQQIQFDNHLGESLAETLHQPDHQRQVARTVTGWFCRQTGVPVSANRDDRLP